MNKAQKDGSNKFLKTVGKNLRGIRTAKKTDIKTVAKAVKISPALLEKIEQGEHDTDIILLFDLCDYYEIAVGDVFEERTWDDK